jgi:hypothetical protein
VYHPRTVEFYVEAYIEDRGKADRICGNDSTGPQG